MDSFHVLCLFPHDLDRPSLSSLVFDDEKEIPEILLSLQTKQSIPVKFNRTLYNFTTYQLS